MGTDESICRAAMEMQTQTTDMWTRWGKEREGQIETVALKHIHLNRQPVGICCMTQGAQTWCSVTTWRGWDEVGGEREVQEGGDICLSKADSC